MRVHTVCVCEGVRMHERWVGDSARKRFVGLLFDTMGAVLSSDEGVAVLGGITTICFWFFLFSKYPVFYHGMEFSRRVQDYY